MFVSMWKLEDLSINYKLNDVMMKKDLLEVPLFESVKLDMYTPRATGYTYQSSIPRADSNNKAIIIANSVEGTVR